MKLLNQILVGTDFGVASDHAVKMASYAAKQFDSKVHVLHVKPKNDELPPDAALADVDKIIAKRLDEIAQQLKDEGARRVESTVAEGLPFAQIDRYAREHDVNAIIIGAGETGASGQVYLGTTASRLRRKASKPVWIVKPGMEPPISRILCAVDFSSSSSRALKNAIHLARRFQAELTVLTVAPRLASGYERLLASDETGEQEESPSVPELKSFLEKYDFHNVTWNQLVRRGKPKEEIVKVAIDMQADLIVMGSAGRTGISRMLVGGVARRVAQEMPCSIITVRSEDPIRLLIEGEVAEVDVNFCAARRSGMSCSRLEHGRELLEQGFSEQAARHFQDCISEYDLCPHAWESLGIARARLGQEQEARK